MKHPFDLDDFESFLSEQADRHRMYAGDRVWRNIQEKLHGIDRWPALTFASILTMAIFSVALTITYPQKDLISTNNQYYLSENDSGKPFEKIEGGKVETIENLGIANIIPLQAQQQFVHSNTTPDFGHNNGGLDLKRTVENINDQKITYAEDNNTEEVLVTGDDPHTLVFTMKETTQPKDPLVLEGVNAEPMQETKSHKNENLDKLPLTHASLKHAPAPIVLNEAARLEVFNKATMEYGPAKSKPVSASKSKLALQIYATPSISYRYLIEDRKFTTDPNSGPVAPYLTNSVNAFVVHRPKMGLEVGGALLFKLSDNFRLKTGLQFNYRQFGISAYSLMQYEPALFALNGANGIDSLVSYTRISAQNGQSPLELTSHVFQVSIPVGFDLKISQVKNVDFYVSASSQLTYNLSNSSYIISTDFKNYLPQPNQLDRRFNVNTAVEAFASFDAGGVTWQAGPQIRYQMLPGSKNAYPIREHLIDFGFKVGIVKRLK